MKQNSHRKRQHRNLGPNSPLIGKPRSRHELATPALILDLDRFEHNLAAMARLVKRARLELRPHAKTHKTVEIARRQIAAGAVGISVATLREATVMVEAGIPGVLLTTPLAGRLKLDLLIGLVGRARGFMAAVDDPATVAYLERGLERGRQRRRAKLPVLVDIDIGMKRTGVPDVAGARFASYLSLPVNTRATPLTTRATPLITRATPAIMRNKDATGAMTLQ